MDASAKPTAATPLTLKPLARPTRDEAEAAVRTLRMELGRAGG